MIECGMRNAEWKAAPSSTPHFSLQGGPLSHLHLAPILNDHRVGHADEQPRPDHSRDRHDLTLQRRRVSDRAHPTRKDWIPVVGSRNFPIRPCGRRGCHTHLF